MGIIVNHELGFTEVRIRQLEGVVDVFVILESKITSGKFEMLYGQFLTKIDFR